MGTSPNTIPDNNGSTIILIDMGCAWAKPSAQKGPILESPMGFGQNWGFALTITIL